MDSEWFPGIPEPSKVQETAFDTTSTVDELSYAPSQGQQTCDAAQVAATGRRSWKTLKGKPEAVWPPALEGALIEALEEYRKMEARPTTSKYGVRYPMRNRFISDFILEKTGETRTAKQVGIRLQQLRDSCEDSRLTSALGGFQLSNNPTPPPDETMAIYVQLVCPSNGEGVPTWTPQLHLNPNDTDAPYYLDLMPLPRHWSDPLPTAYPTPSSILSSFSSFVELVSPFPLLEETIWTAYRDNTLVRQERSVIRLTSALPDEASRRLYVCDLVPSLWPTLCDSEDPNFITIVQKVRSARESSSFPVREALIVYHFNVPDYTKPQSRHATSSYTANAGLPSYSTPSSSASSQAYYPYYPSFPNHASSSQGGEWAWSSQDSHVHRDAGYYPGHRRIHVPPSSTAYPNQSTGSRRAIVRSPHGTMGGDPFLNLFYSEPIRAPWDTNGHGQFEPSNLPVNGAANPSCCKHSQSPSLDGPSVFGQCTNIAVHNSHIRMDVRHPPGAQSTSLSHVSPFFRKGVDSNVPLPFAAGPLQSPVVQEGFDLSRPPAIYSSASAPVRGRTHPRPPPAAPASPTPPPAPPSSTPPPATPPTAPGRRTATIAAIFVLVACLVLW